MATSSQKVIIPKGLVNPREMTIIEIPKNLQNKSAVVARPKLERGKQEQGTQQATNQMNRKYELADALKWAVNHRANINTTYQNVDGRFKNVQEHGDIVSDVYYNVGYDKTNKTKNNYQSLNGMLIGDNNTYEDKPNKCQQGIINDVILKLNPSELINYNICFRLKI